MNLGRRMFRIVDSCRLLNRAGRLSFRLGPCAWVVMMNPLNRTVAIIWKAEYIVVNIKYCVNLP